LIIGLINKLIDLNNNRYAPSLPSSDLKFIGKPIIVNSLPWSESHGFDHKTKNMGAVEFYISLARQYNKPEILVLGSGVGFIPKIFLDNTDGRVLLVDAVNPDVGAGSVFDYGQYFDRNYSHLTSYKPRFFFLPTLTQFAFTLFSKSRNTFDIIFIDADHSEIGFTADLEASIKFLNPDGMIICHDTKLKHIADKIKSTSLNYTFFDIGAGFAILKPFEYASVEGEKWSDSMLEKEINERQNESGARWDYLSDNGFVERIEKYYSIFTELVNLRDLPKIIEIGGNPNPAIRFFDNPGAEILVSVEPYVSNIAKPYFENIKSSHVLVENITQIKSNFDLIIILGADLSLTKNYKTFIKEVTLMYELITNSKYVMIETPNYSPSKLLEEILTQELSLIHQSDFRVNSTTNFSINNDYLDRNFKIYKNGKDSKLLRKKINDEQVETYAKFFQFDGYKFRANQPPPVQGNSLDLNLNFNTWPVEKSGTENFVWLRPHQEILFPKGKKRLEVELLVPPHEVLLESRFKYVLDIQSLKIVIRRRFFSRKVSIKLPFFVPSDKYGTEDKRELSFAVKSYNFS
jgi:hypothetical protein